MARFVKIGKFRLVNLDAIASFYRQNEQEWHLQYLSISGVGPALSSLSNEEAAELWQELLQRAENNGIRTPVATTANPYDNIADETPRSDPLKFRTTA